MDSSITGNIHSYETESNGQLQLKATNSFTKRRSPCNKLRDIQRVKDHTEIISINSSVSEPNLESTDLKASACDHENLHLSSDQDSQDSSKRTKTQESDSGYHPNFDIPPDHRQVTTKVENLFVDNHDSEASSTVSCLNSEKDKISNGVPGAKNFLLKVPKLGIHRHLDLLVIEIILDLIRMVRDCMNTMDQFAMDGIGTHHSVTWHQQD